MANYTVTDPTSNKTVTLTGDSPPTEAELNDIFSKIGGTQPSVAQPDSVMSHGMGYVQQHPFKTALEPLAKTVTGKSLQDMALEASQQNIPTPTQAPFDSNVIAARNPINQFNRIGSQAAAGALGSAADMATTPANYAMAPLMKPIGAGIDAMGNTFSKIPTVLNTAKSADLEAAINKAFVGVKKAATDKFGLDQSAIENANPNSKVSLYDTISNINQNLPEMAPEARAVFQKTPILKDLIKNPELANEVSLSDTQKILNYINTKVPKNIRANHLDILDTLSDIKASQLDAFPEMAGVKADYQKVIEPYNQVKQYFRFNKTLNAIKNGFGGPSGVEAVKKLGFPDEVVQQMGGYKNAARLISTMKKALIPIGVATVGGGAAGAVIKGLSHE